MFADLKEFLNLHWWKFLPLILTLIAVLNVYPQNTIFGTGDFVELKVYSDYDVFFSTLSDRSLGHFNYNSNSWLTWVLVYFGSLLPELLNGFQYPFFYLLSSFYAFVISCNFLSKEKIILVKKSLIYVFAFLYALNPYTSVRLQDPTGFYYPYIFFPLVLTFFLIYFIKKPLISVNLLFYSLTLTIFSAATTNPAYLVGLVFVLGFFAIFIGLFRETTLNSWVSKVVIIFVVSIASLLMYIVPIYFMVFDLISASDNYTTIEWISSQSLSFIKILLFGPRAIYNPDIFSLTLPTFSLGLLLIIFGWSLVKSIGENKLILITTIVLSITLLLISRGVDTIFYSFLLELFSKNALLGSLRSYDKLLFMVPFLILMVILSANLDRKFFKPLILFIALTSSFPASLGLYHSHYFHDDKSYQSSKSFIQIPHEISQINEILNIKKSKLLPRILELPNHIGSWDLNGWVYNESLNLWGVNPLYGLINATMISPSTPITPLSILKNQTRGLNSSEIETSNQLFFLLKDLGINYILFSNISESEKTFLLLTDLMNQGKVKLIKKFEIYSLYEFTENSSLGIISFPSKVVMTNYPHTIKDQLIKDFDEVSIYIKSCIGGVNKNMLQDSNIKTFNIEKPNSTNFKIDLSINDGPLHIYYSNLFNSNWSLLDSNDNEIESTQCLANGFANFWFIDTNKLCQKNEISDLGACNLSLSLSFKPEKYLAISRYVYLILLALALLFFTIKFYRSRVF
jgi:hypothetical protein